MRKKTVLLLLTVIILGAAASGCIGKVHIYDTNPERLAFGETATIKGVAFTVEGYELRDEFVGNHDLNIFYNTKGNKFLYVLVKAENLHTNRVEMPSQYDVRIMYNNRPYRPEVSYQSKEFEMYEFNEFKEQTVEPHHVQEGYVLFEVPETINIAEVEVIVEFPHTAYTTTAIWTHR